MGNGSDQEAQEEEEGSPSQREARCCEDSSEKHDRCPRDDWINCWCLQRQGFHPGRNQARNDWPLLGRILHLLQACEARKARNWSYSLLQIHPSEVECLGFLHTLKVPHYEKRNSDTLSRKIVYSKISSCIIYVSYI